MTRRGNVTQYGVIAIDHHNPFAGLMRGAQ